jgi:RimJ/RimL family protein N-acetyltransferase
MHFWLQEPHVRDFWDDGDRTIEQVTEHYFSLRSVDSYIISCDYLSIGYIQAYPIEKSHPLDPWMTQKGETWGMDLFIGNKTYLNLGLSTPIIQEFINLLLQNPRLKRIITDPEMHNSRAHAIYEKAGLRKIAHDVSLGNGRVHAIFQWDIDFF